MRWDLFAILMLLPWAATFGGSVLAARMQSGGPTRQGAMLGFAAGIMIAASIWSLILPAFDNAGKTPVGAAVVSLGFLLGCLGMLLLDKLVPHQHMDEASPEGRPSHMSRPKLLVLAVALHNIPEGMAVVLPLRQSGATQRHCLRWGFWASLAEPAAAIIGILMTTFLATLGGVVMPVLLSVAAGAMIFIVVEELIPESQSGDHGHAATYGFLLGFWLMALLGVLGG